MKSCPHCQTPFQVTPEDLAFYLHMAVPEPTLCSLCRMQRRLSYRIERFLKHRKCSLTGKQIISVYPSDAPWPVYDIEEWWSDKWNPLSYGRDFDFSRPFFEQFFELRNQVPRLALIQQQPMINSAYCNAAGQCKNCYLCFSSNKNEDCLYSSWMNHCKNCIDCKTINQCEGCYECIDCRDCVNLKWSQNCTNCSYSYFLKNCQGCRDCFGSINLINKEYYIFNKPYNKETYDAFFKEVDLGSFRIIQKMKEKFAEITQSIHVKAFEGVNNENSLGNYIRNNKNAWMCFDTEDSEDARYCQGLQRAKSAMDHSHWGDGTEQTYECQAVGYNGFNLKFCNLCWSGCSDLSYCDHSFSSKNCFGCVGLKKNEYCILNKQYSKEDYGNLKSEIINHMQRTGEWGEFFPAKFSPFGYNETMACEEIPLSKEEALKKGFRWLEDTTEKSYKGPPVEIPNHIREAKNDITKQILISEKSGTPFKIVPQELKFYQQNNIPLPRMTPDERHLERVKKRNPRILFNRTCAKCQKAIQTSYAPERTEQIYCEECYLKEVY